MNVLLYARASKTGNRLLKVIGTVALEERIEICRTIESLSRRLRQSVHDLTITILTATSRKEFFDILNIGDLVRELRTILILPDREHDIVSSGYTLYPRFMSYADSDFKDVAAVLSRMNEQFRMNNKRLKDGR